MKDEKPLYDSFIADYYDTSPILVQRTQDTVFYVNSVKKYGDPALELGCGTGRITMAVAEAGYRIVGLDLSDKMLRRAEEKRATLRREARERVHLVQGDMTRFDLDEKYRVVIIPFRPLQHLLEVQQQKSCLESVRKHLWSDGRRSREQRGRLILDVFQTDAERMHDPEHQKEAPVTEYKTADGRQVRVTERVAAFHRAQHR